MITLVVRCDVILAMGRRGKIKNLKQIFSMQMQKEYFPVGLETMGAQFEFLTFGDKESFYGATVTVVAQHHLHVGGSYGFRVDDGKKALVVCTDVEHLNGIDSSIVNLAKDADLLIHDGQYTPEEYQRFRGWGHSSFEQAAEVAKMANVKRLVITHHDPDHNDDFLDEMEKSCQKIFPDSLFAKEGMEVSV